MKRLFFTALPSASATPVRPCCVALFAVLCTAPGLAQSSVVINEIMQNPDAVSDAAGEWFEIFNPTDSAIDVEGWTIEDNDSDGHVIAHGGPLVVASDGFLVFGVNADPATNGGVEVDYEYSGITLANGADELVLRDLGSAEVDRVEWDDGTTFPDPTGASMELARDRLDDNHLGENWREGWTLFGAGDAGTPGAPNECCITIECYYENVDVADATAARESLHALIDDHVRWPFSSASWEIVELADEAPGDESRVLDIYKNALYDKVAHRCGSPPVPPCFQREHAWPSSYGFPIDTGTGTYPRSDYHHIFVADQAYNGSRSNLPYDTCHSGCSPKPTDFNYGQGGSDPSYPGDSNWREGSGPAGTWETWTGALGGRRGDVARALLYMDVRYDGTDHQTGTPEPDLILTSDRGDLHSDSTNPQDPAYMGILTTVLEWHEQDPPDALELWRNEVVDAYQHNRNPFIDHPEWARCVFENVCAEVLFEDGFESGDTSAWSATVP